LIYTGALKKKKPDKFEIKGRERDVPYVIKKEVKPVGG